MQFSMTELFKIGKSLTYSYLYRKTGNLENRYCFYNKVPTKSRVEYMTSKEITYMIEL